MIRSAVEAFILTHESINIPNTFNNNWASDPVLGDDVELIHITESGTAIHVLRAVRVLTG